MTEEHRIDQAIEAVKHTPIPDGPSPACLDRTWEQLHHLDVDRKHRFYRSGSGWAGWLVSAAAMLLIGFAVGRGTVESQRRTLEHALRTDLYQALRTDMEQRWQAQLQGLASELVNTSHDAATQMATEVVRVMAAQQARQQEQFAMALVALRQQQMQNDTALSQGLTQFASLTRENWRRTDDLAQFIAREHISDCLDRETDLQSPFLKEKDHEQIH